MGKKNNAAAKKPLTYAQLEFEMFCILAEDPHFLRRFLLSRGFELSPLNENAQKFQEQYLQTLEGIAFFGTFSFSRKKASSNSFAQALRQGTYPRRSSSRQKKMFAYANMHFTEPYFCNRKLQMNKIEILACIVLAMITLDKNFRNKFNSFLSKRSIPFFIPDTLNE